MRHILGAPFLLLGLALLYAGPAVGAVAGLAVYYFWSTDIVVVGIVGLLVWALARPLGDPLAAFGCWVIWGKYWWI